MTGKREMKVEKTTHFKPMFHFILIFPIFFFFFFFEELILILTSPRNRFKKNVVVNPLSANHTNWSNTLKQ